MHAARCLTSLVETESNDVRVDHAQVEGSQEQVRVGKSKEHCAVRSWVTLVHLAGRLVCVTGIVSSGDQGCIGKVQLADPCGEHGGAGRSGSDVGVVGTDGLAGLVPGEVDELAGEGEGLRAVANNAGRAAVARVLIGIHSHARLVSGDGGVRWVSDPLANNFVRLGVVG